MPHSHKVCWKLIREAVLGGFTPFRGLPWGTREFPYFLQTLLCKDAVCFVEFVQNGIWGSAACQGTLFIVSSILQFRNTGCKKLARLSLESWNMGLPCNELQRLLVEEKTFEAPLSLFIQSPGAKKHSLVFQWCFLSCGDTPTYTPKNFPLGGHFVVGILECL